MLGKPHTPFPLLRGDQGLRSEVHRVTANRSPFPRLSFFGFLHFYPERTQQWITVLSGMKNPVPGAKHHLSLGWVSQHTASW